MDPALQPITPGSPDYNHRPRPRSRGISFRSDKSGGSGGKFSDSPRDKAQRDSLWAGSTKANPNAALNEVQPGAANVLEQSTLQPLRETDHVDSSGNIITDPDRSNPTRSRMERPLDTIRSFERAIDEGHRRKASYLKQDSETWDRDNQYASKRSSYFGGSENGPSPNRPPQAVGGYYGNQNYHGPPRARYSSSRMQSDPQMYGQRPYQQHNHQQSHDTVNTGNGSDSTGPWANSTDPSSENSSIDKVNAMNKPMDPYANYNANGYNGTIMEERGAGMYNGNYMQEDEYGQPIRSGLRNEHPNGYGPRDPYNRSNTSPGLSQPPAARKPIPLGNSGSGAMISGAPYSQPAYTPEPEKRQSWLKRRFSKKG